jgi:hypothetical protein
MAVLVCVCGAPAKPALSGHTLSIDLAWFLGDFKRLADLLEHQTAETIGDFAAGRFAPADALNELAVSGKLKTLEAAIGRALAAQGPSPENTRRPALEASPAAAAMQGRAAAARTRARLAGAGATEARLLVQAGPPRRQRGLQGHD